MKMTMSEINEGWVPTVAERATESPSSRAVREASTSRSLTTSMWSVTNPSGQMTTEVTPCPGKVRR